MHGILTKNSKQTLLLTDKMNTYDVNNKLKKRLDKSDGSATLILPWLMSREWVRKEEFAISASEPALVLHLLPRQPILR